MDDATFDHFALRVGRSTSRRATLGGLVGLGAALVGPGPEVSAKKKKCKAPDSKCGKACCRAANRDVCIQGKCTQCRGPLCVNQQKQSVCAQGDCCPADAGYGRACGSTCCVNGAACDTGTGTCGACPPHTGCPFALGAGDVSCGEGAFASCRCATSVENATACVTASYSCLSCITDAQCTTHLGIDGLCVDLSGCRHCIGLDGGPDTAGKACVPKGCQ